MTSPKKKSGSKRKDAAADENDSQKRPKKKNTVAPEDISVRLAELAVELQERELDTKEEATRALKLMQENLLLARELEADKIKAEEARQKTLAMEMELFQSEQGTRL